MGHSRLRDLAGLLKSPGLRLNVTSARLGYQTHFPVVALESMRCDADIAEPIKLRTLAKRDGRKLKQLAVAKVAEFSGATWIVTL